VLFRRAVLHEEVLAFDITERAHGLQEVLQEWLLRSGRPQQIPNPVDKRGRLCLGEEWHHEHGEGKDDKRPDTVAGHGRLLHAWMYRGHSTCHMLGKESKFCRFNRALSRFW
jgi:hypothetical protein